MAKIIEIGENGIITIGTPEGTLTEVRRVDLNFEPMVGDEVQIFQNETRTIVSKVEAKTEPVNSTNETAGGINININNSNENTAPVQPVYVDGKKAVNKVAYCLLALFLGSFGGHKFYAGKIGWGIVYLVFCWTYIPGIVAFVEMIIGICKPADAAGRILV